MTDSTIVAREQATQNLSAVKDIGALLKRLPSKPKNHAVIHAIMSKLAVIQTSIVSLPREVQTDPLRGTAAKKTGIGKNAVATGKGATRSRGTSSPESTDSANTTSAKRSNDPRREIILLACGAVGAMTGRNVNADILRSMVRSQDETACLDRGMTQRGRWRYETDVSRAIRKLEEKGVLQKVGHGDWVVMTDIEGEAAKYARDIS
jgi:hypothetical protein